METRADELAAAMAGGGDGGFAVPGDALRWIVSAAEAEAEHAEAALKAAVPSMHDWWNGGVAAAREGSVPAAAPAQKQKEKQKKDGKRRKDAAASGKEAEGEEASAREAETSTRANLAAAVRFLASSGDDESS